MFPLDFVRRIVDEFCPPASAVLDPFCGRGTVPFVAATSGRQAMGIDVNEVAYVYSSAKTAPELYLSHIARRIGEIKRAVRTADRRPVNEFQRLAWSPRVLGFLHAARRELDWQDSRCDRTLMALILVHLHGKKGGAVSNQLRQSKSMAPDYAVRWWTARNLTPPELDPAAYFEAKARWRYAKGLPKRSESRIEWGDARQVLPMVRRRFSLLLTSPPYCGVTDYRLDNWIRLWMLGGSPLPEHDTSQRHVSRPRYREMLQGVFEAAHRCMLDDAVIYVRTDTRSYTLQTTKEVLASIWPRYAAYQRSEQPLKTQTRLFGDASIKPGETDLLLLPPNVRRPLGFSRWANETPALVEAA